MSEFVVNGDMFGMYAKIPTGFSKEMHIYKIVSAFESNAYCNVPLLTIDTKETTHDKLDTVLNVIHCGIDESEVVRVALKDCEIIKKEPQEQPIVRSAEEIAEEINKIVHSPQQGEDLWHEWWKSHRPNFKQYLVEWLTKKEV